MTELTPHLGLAGLLTYIREQLEEADRMRTAANRQPLFQLAGLELELHVAIEETSDVKGGFDLKLISAGASGGMKSEEIQTLKLRWEVPPLLEVVQGAQARDFPPRDRNDPFPNPRL